jgi:formate hydrogenlyase transcriptional activator
MQSSQSMNGHSPQLAGKHVEEVLRFARKLGMHSDPQQLLRALPSELCALLDCTTTAVIHLREGEPSFHVVDGDGCELCTDPSVMKWQEEIWSAVSQREKPLVIPSLDHESRFPETTRFFRESGSRCLCVLPLATSLHRLGALCIGRDRPGAFDEEE